ncbi:hypothetical protein TW80_11135 [Loktanella sp. S4079]|nr:hypothetical protein TW80_11135 [Loktanella sp. S4079]
MKTKDGATAISIAGTSGAVVEDVAIIDAASHGITVANSTDFSMDDIIIDGAHDKGSGGNGYGVWIRDVYDSSFTDLSITDTRHAVVFASYTSATGNNVEVTSTNRDINFHGGLDQNNTVSVVSSIRTGDEIEYMSPSVFFNEGTSYGAPTDKDANEVTFEHVVGTVRSDEVTASDAGATISLMDAADIAHTGAGDDTVDMGTGTDTVYASAGTDVLDGGKGTDKVIFEQELASYGIARDGETLIVAYGVNVTRLTNFETVVFADAVYSFDDVPEQELVREPQRQETDDEVDQPVQEPQLPEPEVSEPEPEEEVVEEPVVDEDDAIEVEPETPVQEPEPTEDEEPTIPEPQDPVVEDTVDEVEEETPETDSEEDYQEQGPDDDFETVDGTSGWQRAAIDGSTNMGEYLEGMLIIGQDNASVIGNDLHNSILGNIGDNWIEGGAGDDRIFARAGDDVVFGGDDDDLLHGQSGDDVLISGDGTNTLIGGSGADRFIVTGGINTILDFNLGKGDTVEFSADGSGALSKALAAYSQGISTFAGFSIIADGSDLTITYEDDTMVTLVDTTIDAFFA